MEVSDKIPSEPESAASDTNSETEDVITDISHTLPVPENIPVSSAHLPLIPAVLCLSKTLRSQ
jgi:hypothetical protein